MNRRHHQPGEKLWRCAGGTESEPVGNRCAVCVRESGIGSRVFDSRHAVLSSTACGLLTSSETEAVLRVVTEEHRKSLAQIPAACGFICQTPKMGVLPWIREPVW